MNIILVTQNAPMYLAGFLDEFVGLLGESGHTLAHLVRFAPTFQKSNLAEVKQRLDLYGPLDFGRMAFRIATNKLSSKISRIGAGDRCYQVSDVIRKHGISCYEVDTINNKNFVNYVREAGIDLILSLASPKIFKRPILHAPRFGCINYHTALLPKYRGRMPMFWALLNGEKEIGVTIHEMDEGIDNGPILVQRRVAVEAGDSLHSLYLKTVAVGPAVLMEAIEKIAAGNSDRLANDASQATYFSFPRRHDARAFRARGCKFF